MQQLQCLKLNLDSCSPQFFQNHSKDPLKGETEQTTFKKQKYKTVIWLCVHNFGFKDVVVVGWRIVGRVLCDWVKNCRESTVWPWLNKLKEDNQYWSIFVTTVIWQKLNASIEQKKIHITPYCNAYQESDYSTAPLLSDPVPWYIHPMGSSHGPIQHLQCLHPRKRLQVG